MAKESKLWASLLIATCAIVVVGCGGGAGAGGVAAMLPRMQSLAAECHGPLDAYDGLDASATAREDPTLTATRLEAVGGLAEQVAACGGVLKVVAFSSGAAETAVLGEARFPTSSGTETARLIKADGVADELLAEVEAALPRAFRELDPDGTDVLAQWKLARQFAEQVPDGHLYVQLETDGLNTVEPVVMNTPSFTPAAARSAAETVALPDLSGTTVRIVGIGETSGRRPATKRVDALTTFYGLACRRSGASRCLVTTDYTAGA